MVCVGTDVSKGSSAVCMMKPGGEIVEEPYEMPHLADSISDLVRKIASCDDEVKVVLESTGYYHWPVALPLLEKGIFVCCVNALRMKRYCAQSLRKGKTDVIDSMKIAGFGLAYWNELLCSTPNQGVYAELQMLSRQYYQYTNLLVKAKINLGSLLDQMLPGIQTILIDMNGNHKLTGFAQKYWHKDNVLSKGEKAFAESYCKWAKKQHFQKNEQKAAEIYALCENAVATMPSSITAKFLLQEAVRLLWEIERSQQSVLDLMQQLAISLPEYSVVRKMGGIGPKLAPRLIAEIGDVRRFHSKGALVAYAGIDSPPFQSGVFEAKNRPISKRGNKYLRRTGFEIMQSLMRHPNSYPDDPVCLFIQKKVSEGKNSKFSKIAGFNKFLKIYYARVCQLYLHLEKEHPTLASS